jgi:hypothetical protein
LAHGAVARVQPRFDLRVAASPRESRSRRVVASEATPAHRRQAEVLPVVVCVRLGSRLPASGLGCGWPHRAGTQQVERRVARDRPRPRAGRDSPALPEPRPVKHAEAPPAPPPPHPSAPPPLRNRETSLGPWRAHQNLRTRTRRPARSEPPAARR